MLAAAIIVLNALPAPIMLWAIITRRRWAAIVAVFVLGIALLVRYTSEMP